MKIFHVFWSFKILFLFEYSSISDNWYIFNRIFVSSPHFLNSSTCRITWFVFLCYFTAFNLFILSGSSGHPGASIRLLISCYVQLFWKLKYSDLKKLLPSYFFFISFSDGGFNGKLSNGFVNLISKISCALVFVCPINASLLV